MDSYSVSRDGKTVAFAMTDHNGHANLWVAPTNRRSSPVKLTTTGTEDSPLFLPDGDLVFRALEGGSNFLYHMKADGSDRHKIIDERITEAISVSPDGKWLVVGATGPDEEHNTVTKAFSADGSKSVMLCPGYCLLRWDTAGNYAYLNFSRLREANWALPTQRDSQIPKLPLSGIARREDLVDMKNATQIPEVVDSAISPSVYAFTRRNIRRTSIASRCLNLYLTCRDSPVVADPATQAGIGSPNHANVMCFKSPILEVRISPLALTLRRCRIRPLR